jgi:hypothetical protein
MHYIMTPTGTASSACCPDARMNESSPNYSFSRQFLADAARCENKRCSEGVHLWTRLAHTSSHCSLPTRHIREAHTKINRERHWLPPRLC